MVQPWHAADALIGFAERQVVLRHRQMPMVVQDKNFQAAAALAFELGHAGRLLSVVESAMTQGAESAQAILGGLVRDLSPDQLKQCLEFARDWNTNSRRCHAAQALLQAIISEHTPEVRSLGFSGACARTNAALDMHGAFVRQRLCHETFEA